MSNHLAQETSPYLLQHANNPVDWMPWSEQALALAREQNKPILLSIGYSACHWCHVMAHESFEDPAVAEIMNRLFVNIKVDREERPDLDHIYQAAHNLLTRRSGGWPLTMFLTPDQKPFFGGTYFPKEPRYNLPGFPGMLERVAEFYHSNHDEINKQNASLIEALTSNQTTVVDTGHLLEAPLDDAVQQFGRTFDQIHGGFGGAPKFPRPSDMAFLLAQGKQHHDHEMTSSDMALFTLAKMAEGGIFDQLGGGFCRYSVDEKWVIPHFEKMLYDNGPLLGLYADTYAASGDDLFRRTAEETAAWTIREMQSPEGGYYSALDADSEHEEGKFYVWTPDEAAGLLSPEEYAVAAPYYGLNRPPNFENRHWHLIAAGSLESIARALHISTEEAGSRLASARQKLFAARGKRVHPGRDEKILVSWNALMIKGMAHAGRRLNRPEWIASARKALEFIHSRMWENGRLLATYKDGKAHLNAYLDDYAFLLDTLLELLQADFREDELAFAMELADVMLAQFEDGDNGGFFFTSHDHEKLISRPKSGYDNAIPSGNGIAALALQRLGHLAGEQRYLISSLKTLKFFYPAVKSQAFAFASLLMTLQEHLFPPQIVILRGPGQEIAGWQQALGEIYLPDTLILGIPDGIKGLPQSLNKPSSDKVNAWVCQGVKCLPAIDNLDSLVATIGRDSH